ncbi:MAG: complex I subunit 5 family protein [Candidatus Onthomonas sp.]
MSQHWILAAILLPLLAGALLLLRPVDNRKTRSLLVMAVSLLTSLLLGGLLLSRPEGTLTLGAIHPALTFAFRVDSLSLVFLAILAVLWPIAVLYSFEYMSHEHEENRFFGFFTMTYGVVVAIATAANLFTLYFCYELLTLCTLPLVMHEMDGKARYAGKTYILYSMSGAALAFVAMVVVAHFGSLDFVLGGSLDAAAVAGQENLLRVFFLLGFFGFGVKAAVWPGHRWLPTASVAPTPVSALLHAVAVVNAGVFAILRLTYYSFGTQLLKGSFAQWVMMGACILTIVFGSAMSWRLQHLKRRLAYSTVSNLSYILLGASVMTGAGLGAALLHMAAHSVFKIILFFCAGAILCQTKREYIFQLPGLGRRMPVTFTAFAMASLGLIGIPPFAGFYSKWAIAEAAVELNHPVAWLGALALAVSAFFTGLYQVMVLVPAFFPTREQEEIARENSTFTEAGWQMKVALILLMLLALAISFGVGGLSDVLSRCAQGLM